MSVLSTRGFHLGPRFRRWSREEIVADTPIGYYSLRSFLANLEAWRLVKMRDDLESLLAWGAWRFNSEQKAEVKAALARVKADLKRATYATKSCGEYLSRAKKGQLAKPLPGGRRRGRALPSVTDVTKKVA